jgi:NAD-dependent deacetylase
MNREKIVVFTGSGISAPSGIPTFRATNGLWQGYRLEDVATPEAWRRQPERVLEFYNERRARAATAEPNAAHRAVAALEQRFEVIVVTQNVDDLHERGGSSQVIHLHGELRKARSTADPNLISDIGGAPIRLGDKCTLGSQLRPHIVWFGEQVMHIDEARDHVEAADRILVVGTSLVVYPAAGLVEFADPGAEKVMVDLEIDSTPPGFRCLEGSADIMVPKLVTDWMNALL